MGRGHPRAGSPRQWRRARLRLRAVGVHLRPRREEVEEFGRLGRERGENRSPRRIAANFGGQERSGPTKGPSARPPGWLPEVRGGSSGARGTLAPSVSSTAWLACFRWRGRGCPARHRITAASRSSAFRGAESEGPAVQENRESHYDRGTPGRPRQAGRAGSRLRGRAGTWRWHPLPRQSPSSDQ